MQRFVLFNQVMRSDSRHWFGYTLRFVVAGVMTLLLIGPTLSLLTNRGGATSAGLNYCHMVMAVNAFFICLSGTFMFSTVISEEKEVNTLSLLLLTGLTPFSLLLSKSSSRLVWGLLLLLVQVPFTLLSVTFGGVTVEQVLACYLVLLGFTFFLSNMALFASVLTPRSRSAVSLAGVLVLITCFLPEVSPFRQINWILNTGFSGPVWSLGETIYLVGGTLFFLLSVVAFNYTIGKQQSSDLSDMRSLLLGRRYRTNLLLGIGRAWQSPIIWHTFNYTLGGKLGIWTRSGIYLGLLAVSVPLIEVFGQLNREELYGTLSVIIGTMLVFDTILCTGRCFNQELTWKTLPSLVMMPVTPLGIVYSKFAGVGFAMLPGVVALGISTAMIDYYVPLAVIPLLILNLLPTLYLVAFFCLHFKSGGILISFAVYIVLMVLMGCLGFMGLLVAAVIFHFVILEKIKTLAAEIE